MVLAETPGVTLEYRPLDGIRGLIEEHEDGSCTIVLAPNLSEIEARCVLAHELAHLTRRLTFHEVVPDVLVELEELRVDLEAAANLVPPVELVAFARNVLMAGGTVSLTSIAEAFRVEERVARLALDLAASPWTVGFGGWLGRRAG